MFLSPSLSSTEIALYITRLSTVGPTTKRSIEQNSLSEADPEPFLELNVIECELECMYFYLNRRSCEHSNALEMLWPDGADTTVEQQT